VFRFTRTQLNPNGGQSTNCGQKDQIYQNFLRSTQIFIFFESKVCSVQAESFSYDKFEQQPSVTLSKTASPGSGAQQKHTI
jgi:hypothetical protein